MKFETGGREVIFSALFGSHNYNLNHEGSDKDYKAFVLPTFEDLYYGKSFSTSVVGEDFDYDVHDIRKTGELFWKTNINFIEVLYSKEFNANPKFHYFTDWLLDKRDKLVTMNLPYFYSACVGMHYEKMKRAQGKGTASTAWMIEKYGWELKEGTHAFRVIDFLARFAESDFTDFESALRYNTEDNNFIREVRQGKYSFEEFQYAMQMKMKLETIPLKEKYNQPPNENLKSCLEESIFNLVGENL